VKETEILKFFMEDIDDMLNNYEPGNPLHKQDVKKQLADMKVERENKIQQHIKKQTEYQNTMNKINMLMNPQGLQEQINDQITVIQQLTLENNQLKEKVEYLNAKIKQFIMTQIDLKKSDQPDSVSI
jgi:hypothetical protein